jgi:hypothetical protein
MEPPGPCLPTCAATADLCLASDANGRWPLRGSWRPGLCRLRPTRIGREGLIDISRHRTSYTKVPCRHVISTCRSPRVDAAHGLNRDVRADACPPAMCHRRRIGFGGLVPAKPGESAGKRATVVSHENVVKCLYVGERRAWLGRMNYDDAIDRRATIFEQRAAETPPNRGLPKIVVPR